MPEEIYLESYMSRACDQHKAQGDNIRVLRTPDGTHIIINDSRFHFILGKTPFNSEQAIEFINNKWSFYKAKRLKINIPHTESFYKKGSKSIEEIVQDINQKVESETHPFIFPLVIKPENGSLSDHVYIVHNIEELKNSYQATQKSEGNGDLALVQQYIGPAKEYRAICLDGQCIFAYEKNIDNAKENGKVNPMYWEGSKPIIVGDKKIIEKISLISMSLYQNHDIQYVGLDLRIDENGTIRPVAKVG